VVYLRTQLTDTLKWRLNQHHSEVLKDIHSVIAPMANMDSLLQDEVNNCSKQVFSMIEDVASIKQRSVSLQMSSVVDTPSQTSESVVRQAGPPLLTARLQRLQSTMQPDVNHDLLTFPAEAAVQGRFIGKSQAANSGAEPGGQ